MSIATVNQLYNYTTSRDQHAFLPVLTTYIETDHKWQDVPPTVNTGGNAVQQSTFYLPTTLGELLGTMILRFNINISVSAVIAAGVLNMARLTRFLALRAISNWTLSHQGRTIDEMSYNLDVLRIYYNLFQDDETFTAFGARTRSTIMCAPLPPGPLNPHRPFHGILVRILTSVRNGPSIRENTTRPLGCTPSPKK